MAELQDLLELPVGPENETARRPTAGTEHETGPTSSKKTRYRILRGMQRISSSPSLTYTGRSRSLSNPYSTRASLSCASLTASFTSLTPSPAASSFSTNGTPVPSTPASEITVYDGIESRLAIRKVDKTALGTGLHSSPTTVPLPAEVKALAKLSQVRPDVDFWASMPYEIRLHILSYLRPRELVRMSCVSRGFYHACFDGQLWTMFDTSDFYKIVPADSLAKIIMSVAPFIQDLNLRGCVQVEHYKRAEVVVKACKNLLTVTLEGCRNLRATSVHGLIIGNERLVHLNVTGLTAVTDASCGIIATSCPRLQALNVSWCSHVTAAGLKEVVQKCKNLKDLRACEIRGFADVAVAEVVFSTNRLERLVLGGCADLTDDALKTMLHGVEPEVDILTDLPMVPTRRLRHLDLSRCVRLTNDGVKAMAHFVPELEGLSLSGCTTLGDAALQPIFASTPKISHLGLEEMAALTNSLFADHLARSPCASRLRHLSVSYCDNLGDSGLLPVVKNCVDLRSIYLDNTRISNFVLAEAISMVQRRSSRTGDPKTCPPQATLHMAVYDCQNVTPTGIREVLYRNALVRRGYPTEIISLRCFYGYQPTVDEHMKRVLRGDFDSAERLEKKWGDYMQVTHEATAGSPGVRRRRRRAREAALLHADEEDGSGPGGRRRARTMTSCVIM